MATERERETPVLVIDDLPTAYGLKATWGLGNQLFVFPGKKTSKQGDVHTDLQGEPVSLHEVKWNTDVHGTVPRKLVNETHNIFSMLQRQAVETKGPAFKPLLVKASKQYRAVLKACSMGLQVAADASVDEPQRAQYENQVQIFELVELIWGLCEILLIDIPASGVVLSQLLEWLRWHFTEGERLAIEIGHHEEPESHPSYWDAVYRLMLQGRMDEVRRLLSSHSARGTDTFISIDDLLRKMPLYAHMSRSHSLAEFDMKWRHWRDECERRLQQGDFAANGNIEVIAKLLCGDESTFRDLRDLCETWYHMLVSKMLYQNPTVKAADLRFYVQGCIDEYRGLSTVGQLDNILLAAMEFNIHQVIRDSSLYLSSWWFVSHLTDLLHHCGQMESHQLNFGSNLREYLLLEYASSLMSHKSLWQVGVDYLDQCPEFGRKYLEHYIEHMPLETERKAHKVLRICEDREMQDQARSICKVMGMRCLHNKRLGSALSWFLKSKDVAFATMLAERFLTEYAQSGDFSNLDLIDNLGPAMLLSNRLTFLGKYREFHKLYESGDFLAAASLLLSLLSARLAPREFWLTLLTDALPLLETEEVIFTMRQTYELMHCLEELTKDAEILGDIDGQEKKVSSEMEKEKLDLLKLALTRNLARAIIQEGTIQT